MIEITSDQVTAELLSLFDFTQPTMPRAFNVLDGFTRGQILVEALPHPTWAVIHEVVYGTLYTGGQVEAALLKSLVAYFHETSDIGIGCWPEDPLNGMLPPNPDYDGGTLYFTERSHTRDVNEVALPGGYSLAIRDAELLKQSFDYESTLASFGSEENTLKHTLGVDILFEGKVVCEAATGAPAQERIEVGVMTAESHRQRGLASIACASLIAMCEAHGYSTWWDCAKQNIPSIKLARKLGFCNEREYRYVWWSRQKVSCEL